MSIIHIIQGKKSSIMGLVATWNNIQQYLGQVQGSSAKFLADHELPLAEKSVSAICALADKYPNTIKRNTYTTALVDSMCPIAGIPISQPTPPSFSGGQCPGIQYEILVVSSTQFNGNDRPDRNSRLVLYGEIEDVYLTTSGQGTNNALVVEARGKNVNGGVGYASDVIGGIGFTAQIQSVDLNRLDGQADNCGDADGEYPPDPIYEPGDGVVNVYGDEYNWDVDNFDGNTFKFLSDNGLTINISPEGIALNDEEEELPPGGGGGVTTKFDPEELEEEPIPIEEEPIEEEDDEIEFVTITVTGLPDSGKTYVSDNQADIHFHAAYFRWLGTGQGAQFSYPDIPIRRLRTVLKRPDEAGGFRVYPVNGAIISVSKYTEKQEEDS